MKKVLIIGGSGGLSGMLAGKLLQIGQVWTLTRGNRPLPDGVIPLAADRDQEDEFRNTVRGAGVEWDVVFDCICMNENHARQDLLVLPKVSRRLVVISTDSVYDPARKKTPQNEEGHFVEEEGAPETVSYAGNKRRMEKVFLEYIAHGREETGAQNNPPEKPQMNITLFRPGHIYGPGFLLGCYPEHSRQDGLPERILTGQPLSLVAGGIYLTQPTYVEDLAETMIDAAETPGTFNEIFCIGGPDAVENRIYYEILGTHLGIPVTVREIPLSGYLTAHPEYAGHLCHRIYDLSKLRATGVKMPATPLADGLKKHLAALGFH